MQKIFSDTYMNDILPRVAAFCAALVILTFASGPARASKVNEVFEVHNFTELTNACYQADSNYNTIKVYPGTYYVGDVKMGTQCHLLMKSGTGRKFLGMGKTPGETVIVGKGMDSNSGCCVIEGAGNTVFSNVTITGGCSISRAGGGINGGYGGSVIDCVISNNYTGGAGGGTDIISAYNTLYIGNRASSGNGGGGRFSGSYTSRNCTFTNNYANNGGGVSLGTHYNAKFYCNTSSQAGGGVHSATIYGGVFIGNRTAGTSGSAAINGGSVTNGYFRDNISTNASSGSHSGEVALSSTFDDCKFYDHVGKDDMFKSCTFKRCEIRTLKEHGVHRDLLNGCTFYNTLLVNLVHDYGSGSVATLATGCSFYNCTLVAGTNLASGCMNTNCRAVNTLFADFNRNIPDLTYLTNCLWTAGSPTTAVGGGKVTTAKLKFKDASTGDYAIRRGSAARNAGWSDAAYLSKIGPLDLAGNDRVNAQERKATTIDVGAYEFSDPVTPTLFSVH